MALNQGFVAAAGHFLELMRFWKTNDTLELTIPVAMYTERIQGKNLVPVALENCQRAE